MSDADHDYPTETHGNTEVPSPGRWRLNWATGQVASWYYDEKTRDATYAHYFDTPSACYIEIGDDRIDIDADTHALKHAAVAAALRRHTPDNG